MTIKSQHYVWRNYLKPWTHNSTTKGKIWCGREKKIFNPSLINIAQENYFYKLIQMSSVEIKYIKTLPFHS
jgi:hypothetical protein